MSSSESPLTMKMSFFLYSLLSFLLVFLHLPNGPNEKNCKRRGWVREKQRIIVEKLLFNPKLRLNKMARKANRQFLLSLIFFQVFFLFLFRCWNFSFLPVLMEVCMSVSVDEDDPIENEGNSFCSTQPQKNPNNYFFSPNIHIKARRRRKKKKEHRA